MAVGVNQDLYISTSAHYPSQTNYTWMSMAYRDDRCAFVALLPGLRLSFCLIEKHA